MESDGISEKWNGNWLGLWRGTPIAGLGTSGREELRGLGGVLERSTHLWLTSTSSLGAPKDDLRRVGVKC